MSLVLAGRGVPSLKGVLGGCGRIPVFKSETACLSFSAQHSPMSNLTKRDLVMQISKETGIIQAEVFTVIQQTLDAITTALASGRDVELRNFGVFEVRLTKSRVGRNPKKPEKDVTIPARATVKFKAGKIMRQRVLLRTQELSKK